MTRRPAPPAGAVGGRDRPGPVPEPLADLREILRKVRHIEIVTTRLAEQQLAGQYHSAFRGRGMTFQEVRPYQLGDDVRAIDWNVSARMNEPFVKVFTEERETTVLLLVDMSASGAFGTRQRPKRDLAAEIAAVLAFSAIRNNDRVGLIVFSDRIEKFVPAKKGRTHVLRVVREILGARPAGRGTDVRAALEFLARVAPRRAIAFVLSDFIPTPGVPGFEPALRIVARKHDVVPVVLRDPVEDELPDVGLVDFEDLETGEVVTLDTGGPQARGYQDRVRAGREHLARLFRQQELDGIEVRTDRPYLPALVAFFRARERRLRH